MSTPGSTPICLGKKMMSVKNLHMELLQLCGKLALGKENAVTSSPDKMLSEEDKQI